MTAIKICAQLVYAILIVCLCAGSASATPSLTFSGSTLTGVQGLAVGSMKYDVKLADGSCDSVYSSCTDFAFTTFADAQAASASFVGAVLASPFWPINLSNFFGCGITAANPPGVCQIETPFEILDVDWCVDCVFMSQLVFYPDGTDPALQLGLIPASADLSINDQAVFAVWTPSAIPEPSSIAVLLAAVLTFGLVRLCSGNSRGQSHFKT